MSDKKLTILHFSDFHLDKNHLKDAENLLYYFCEAISQKAGSIDLVVFSGDMINLGGGSFDSIKDAFDKFDEVVITEVCRCLRIDKNRFIFAYGNHDIDRDKIPTYGDDEIDEKLSTEDAVSQFMIDKKNDPYSKKRFEDVKNFENDHFSSLSSDCFTYRKGDYQSNYILKINDLKVGVSSLNTIWRCGNSDNGKILLGIRQINESVPILDGCDIRIATTHYRYDMLKEFERNLFKEKLAENYEIFFSGHTHSNHVEFTSVAPSGDAFLDVNTAGSLSQNEYVSDIKHINAFQIITYFPKKKAEVSIYRQIGGGQFQIDKNFGVDGVFSKTIPTTEEGRNNANKIEKENNESEHKKFLSSILPIKQLDDYRTEFSDSLFCSDFVTNEKIDHIKSILFDESKKRLRLMALSGMGKTRMVFDVFRNKSNVYYTPISECIAQILVLLDKVKDGVLIIDNCPISDLLKIEKQIKELNSPIKVISIYNNLIPDEKKNSECLILNHEDTSDIVDKLLERELFFDGKEQIKAFIKERSENIPFMAVLMIEAYKRNGEVKSEDMREITNSLLLSIQDITDQKEIKALRSLSLFEPLGYLNPIDDEYNFITNNYKLHQIAENQKIVNQVFEQAIKNFAKRQFIEIAGKCLRIRPRPLSEWMTETWIENNENAFGDICAEITELDESLSKRLSRALNNRFSEMAQSSRAKQLFDQYNNPETGSFHDERIAFSKSGSQLFLSMGLVSPVMVAKNLESLISSKSIQWLKNELDHDARRNLIWAMENIAMNEDAFEPVAKSLGKLALAENESISNNATGQFLQLFHILLSGTKANLLSRVIVLKYFETIDGGHDLLLKAIDHAFFSHNFVRAVTSRYAIEGEEDYRPTFSEVKEYWTECLNILVRLTGREEVLCDNVCQLLEKHVRDFLELGFISILLDCVETIAERKNYEWGGLRDALSENLYCWFTGTEDEKVRISALINKLSPKSFYAKLQAFVKDERSKSNFDWDVADKRIQEDMPSYAEEFLANEIYKTDELCKMIDDIHFNQYHFVNSLSKKISETQSDVLIGELLKRISSKPHDVESPFVYLLAENMSAKRLVKILSDSLYDKGYYRMSSSLQGILDRQKCDSINQVIEYTKNGVYDDICINNYLRRCDPVSMQVAFSNFSLLKKAGLNQNTIVYPYLLTRFFYNIQKIKENKCLEFYKEALLTYPFSYEYKGQSQDVISDICNVLDGDNDNDFAYKVHKLAEKLVVENVCDSSPFDRLYRSLLPKYQDAVLEDLLEILGSTDKRISFYVRMYLYLGSGFGHGKGPLFQCDEKILKEKCQSNPSVLPERLASMCPVYDFDDNGPVSISSFFLWLCENYGNDKKMLSQFGCNMETEGWHGVSGYSDYVANKKKFIEPLLSHQNETVRKWAQDRCDIIEKRSCLERENEEYSRMVRG
ncbi:MAG: metallophosphoesterase [Paludibacteraceae bacterium]|nr:metallophosphoesterase [Paludibacteraceae bacterium]